MINYSKFQKILTIVLIFILTATAVLVPDCSVRTAHASNSFRFIVLSSYNKTVKIGQSFYLAGVCSDGSYVRWKSSNSRVASVNTYGQVTAKKAGTCKITARVTGAEASCRVIVEKTEITLSATSVSMENGKTYTLGAKTSNGSAVTWKSSKKSVAVIDDRGKIEALKPGTTTVTASADGSKKTCKVTVRRPTVTLNKTKIELYRGQTFQLVPEVSSGRTVTYSSKKTSVAGVDENGLVTAYKHGTARIQAKVDGIIRICEVTVKSPQIVFSPAKITLKKGQSTVLKVRVSSGNKPVFSSSKTSVASVDADGRVTARKKGTCIIYIKEDGTKESCPVTVTDK